MMEDANESITLHLTPAPASADRRNSSRVTLRLGEVEFDVAGLPTHVIDDVREGLVSKRADQGGSSRGGEWWTRWPMWSKCWTLFLSLALASALIAYFVGAWVTNEWARAFANVVVATLALLSAVAIAVADSVHGIDRSSKDPRVRWSSRLKIGGHAFLIVSIGYLVALSVADWQLTSFP